MIILRQLCFNVTKTNAVDNEYLNRLERDFYLPDSRQLDRSRPVPTEAFAKYPTLCFMHS